jgi:hypothetical protein
MKNKKIASKINRSYEAIKAFNNRAKSSINDETNSFFEKLLKNHDHAISLRDEIADLQSTLKSKKKQISKSIKDLTENRKMAIKALKKSRKNHTIDTAFQAVKSRTSRSAAQSKEKSGDSPEKPTKTAAKKPE